MDTCCCAPNPKACLWAVPRKEEEMNTSTWILTIALLAVCALVVRSIVKNRAKGGCAGCPHASACGKDSCG